MGFNDMMVAANPYGRRRPPVNWNDPNATAAEQGDQYNTASGYGDRANSDYLGAAENFDASKALNTYAQGAYGSISDALKKQLSDLSGQATGAGRFDSGFYDQDNGTVINQATKQLADSIAQQSMGALGAQQRNTEGLAAFGQSQQGTANDLLAARREEQVNAQREQDAQKRAKKRGIGGLIGGVIGGAGGFLLGGPAGAAAGYGIGSQVGSSF
ncbi:MAG TPA: hypothetical protein VL333_13230 [Candidatus Saccharimonadales bacterium]|jgi:hypothetical protein|nr:hypothetical protein [Candidatus Saccharimonadales bacterium]